MNKELIKEIIDYVEFQEKLVENEVGRGRNFDELVKDGYVPEFYFKLKQMYEKEDN